MDSNGQRAMAQRSEEGRWEWAAEHARDLHVTEVAVEMLRGEGLEMVEGLYLPSQRMQSKGEQGSQTTLLPVSM